jgi:putative transposase
MALTSHVRRYHKHYGSSGHVWQGRFKSFPVQRDEHLLMVLRYVLQNPVRSGLAASVNDWPWSSWCRSDLTDPYPIEVEANWMTTVDDPLSTSQLASIRESVNRGGSADLHRVGPAQGIDLGKEKCRISAV